MVRTSPVLASLLAVLLTVPAGATTRAEIDEATRRLKALETQITSQEDAAERLAVQLREQGRRVGAARDDVIELQREVRAIETRLREVEAQHAALRAQVVSRARSVYMHGSFGWVDMLLSASSMPDFAARIAYAVRLVRRDTDLALGVERLGAQLDAERTEQRRVLSEEAMKLRVMQAQERELRRTFARQQSQLASLAKARAEAQGLIAELKDKLRAEELASAVRAAGRGMPITFGEWAASFLPALGAPAVRENMIAVVAWQTAEYTKATWNPLATTMPMPGATVYNSHGVRNYMSKEQGIEASIKTLQRPGHRYEAIISSLRAGAAAETTADAINASNWCRGCAGGTYVVSLIPAVREYYDRYAGK